MNKVSLLLFVLVLFSLPLRAWDWGVEGGVDLSRFKASKGLMSQDNRVGWFVGAKFKCEIPMPNLGFDVALLYNQNRLSYTNKGMEAHKNLHMFVVPLNLRYDYEVAQSFNVYMATGPQWNWYVGKSDIGGIGKMHHSFFDWNIGAGFEILKHVQLGFNYNIPLGKMGELNNVDLEGRTWNFRAAYFF